MLYTPGLLTSRDVEEGLVDELGTSWVDSFYVI